MIIYGYSIFLASSIFLHFCTLRFKWGCKGETLSKLAKDSKVKSVTHGRMFQAFDRRSFTLKAFESRVDDCRVLCFKSLTTSSKQSENEHQTELGFLVAMSRVFVEPFYLQGDVWGDDIIVVRILVSWVQQANPTSKKPSLAL